LRYQTFRHYCRLNAALEASAELGYERLAELCDDPEDHATFERVRNDEARHGKAFRVLANALTDDDRLSGPGGADLADRLAAISVWFVPARFRPASGPVAEPRSRANVTVGVPDRLRSGFGSRRPVVVRHGTAGAAKAAVLEECLDRAGLGEMAVRGGVAAVRVAFMLGYDRQDRSNVTSPEMVELLALYLRRHGVAEVAVLEAPTVYGNNYAHRSVAEVASYFGFTSPSYRVVDISQDMRPFTYERGFVEHAISATWHDADLRVVMPKLRTAPTDFAHLSLCTLEGMTGRIDGTVYAGRQVDYRSATMMLLDVAPPDFSVIDGWEPVADGPFGVMACHRPALVRHVYSGADALSVDEVVLADMGIAEPPRLAPGLPVVRARADGRRGRWQAARPPCRAQGPPRVAGLAGVGGRVGPRVRVPERRREDLCPRDRRGCLPAVDAGRAHRAGFAVGDATSVRTTAACRRRPFSSLGSAYLWPRNLRHDNGEPLHYLAVYSPRHCRP
jgi:hypothetical protein